MNEVPAQRTVLITGASRNIGARLAARYAADGDAVVMVARSADALEEAAAPIRARGGDVLPVAGDLTVPGDIQAVVAAAEEHYGRIDVLVHNAVCRSHRPFLETSDDEVMQVFGLSALAPLRLSQAVLPGMLERGWGRLLYTLGNAVHDGGKQRAALVSAKSAMWGLMRALAREFAGTGVTANAVSPGVVATHRGSWTSSGESSVEMERRYQERVRNIPLGRMAEIDEVCAAFEYLTGPDSGYTTGQVINVNGGSFLGS